MAILSELKTVSTIRPKHVPPIVGRRNKLLKRLHDQLECAKAKLNGDEYIVTKYKSKPGDNGERLQVPKQSRVRPWWFTTDSGGLVFEVRYGGKRLELAKGKAGIEVENLPALASTIELLKQAVANGELDNAISAIAKNIGGQFGSGS